MQFWSSRVVTGRDGSRLQSKLLLRRENCPCVTFSYFERPRLVSRGRFA